MIDNGLISDKKSIETFVEYTREEDTWDWKDHGEEGKKAHMLSTLFNIYGKDNTKKAKKSSKTIIINKYSTVSPPVGLATALRPC